MLNKDEPVVHSTYKTSVVSTQQNQHIFKKVSSKLSLSETYYCLARCLDLTVNLTVDCVSACHSENNKEKGYVL